MRAFAINYNGLTCSSKTITHIVPFIGTTQVRKIERSWVRTFRIKIWAVLWRMVRVTKLKSIRLYNVNSQWWEGIGKEMQVVVSVPLTAIFQKGMWFFRLSQFLLFAICLTPMQYLTTNTHITSDYKACCWEMRELKGFLSNPLS